MLLLSQHTTHAPRLPPAAHRDVFWESTGLNGQSTIREVDLESGKVLRRRSLPHVSSAARGGRAWGALPSRGRGSTLPARSALPASLPARPA